MPFRVLPSTGYLSERAIRTPPDKEAAPLGKLYSDYSQLATPPWCEQVVLTPGNDRLVLLAASSCQGSLFQECSDGFAFGGAYVEEKFQPGDAQDFRNSRVQSGELDLRIPVAGRYQDRTEGTNSATVDLSNVSHLQDNLLSFFEGLPCSAHQFIRFRTVRQLATASKY